MVERNISDVKWAFPRSPTASVCYFLNPCRQGPEFIRGLHYFLLHHLPCHRVMVIYFFFDRNEKAANEKDTLSSSNQGGLGRSEVRAMG